MKRPSQINRRRNEPGSAGEQIHSKDKRRSGRPPTILSPSEAVAMMPIVVSRHLAENEDAATLAD